MREILQIALSSLAWCLIFNLIPSHIKNPRISKITLYFILAIAISPQIIQWETSLLGTSLMLTSCLILIILVLTNSENTETTNVKYFTLLFVSYLLLAEKSSNLPLAVVVSTYLIWNLRHNASKTFSKLISLVLILTIISFGIISGVNINKKWEYSYVGYTLLWQLGSQSPAAPQFASYLQKGKTAPSCIYQNAPYQDLGLEISSFLKTCQGVKPYLRNQIQRDFASFILSNPTSVVRLVSVGLGATMTNASGKYGSAVTVLPESLSSLIFGETRPELASGDGKTQTEGLTIVQNGNPIWLATPSILILLAYPLITLIQIRNRRGKLMSLENIVWTTLIFQLLLSWILLPSEWFRQSIPYLVPCLVLGILKIAKYFDPGHPLKS